MEGPLSCSCGSTNLTIHKVRLVSGFAPGEGAVETTLTTKPHVEDVKTFVSQREFQDPDISHQIEMSFRCMACKSWKNRLSVTASGEDYEKTYVSWEPAVKRVKKEES